MRQIDAHQIADAHARPFYPMAARGTGIGWAPGVGRIGAIAAPSVIDVLVGRSLSRQQSIMAIEAPGLIAAVANAWVDHRRSASPRQARPSLMAPARWPAVPVAARERS